MAVDLQLSSQLVANFNFKARHSVKTLITVNTFTLIAVYFFDRIRWLLKILLSPAFFSAWKISL